MRTLNLAYPEQSDIPFKVSKYPDGQQDICLLQKPGDIVRCAPGEAVSMWYVEEPIRIESRFNNLEDLGIILCATKALRRLGVESLDLYIPYLLGSRSDRLFKEGATSYLVDVIAPILNEQNYKHVVTYDAHSDVAAACIDNLKVQDNYSLVKEAIEGLPKETVIVSPDAGALKKVYKVTNELKYEGPVLVCNKSRDTEGKLSRLSVSDFDWPEEGDFAIIDDICDGGRTFTGIAEYIKARSPKAKVHLIVSHGIFSAGFEPFKGKIDSIYCTNSVKDVNNDFVKQLNIFTNDQTRKKSV